MDSPISSGSPLKKKMKTDSDLLVSKSELSSTERDDGAPAWFRAYEARQNARFDKLLTQCADTHHVLQNNIDELGDEVKRLSAALMKAEDRIDEMENRSRRNNIVIFNLPEGKENTQRDTTALVKELVKSAQIDVDIEACTSRIHRTPTHRSNKENQRPRPIHVGFNNFRDKERVKKQLIHHLSTDKEKDRKIFIGEDLSKRIQERRKAQMSTFKALREKGLKPFFLFPDILKAKDPKSGKIMSQIDALAESQDPAQIKK